MRKIHLSRSFAYAATIYVGLFQASLGMEGYRPDFREVQERSDMEKYFPPNIVNWRKIDFSNLSQDDRSYLNNGLYHRIELINPTILAINDLSRMIKPDTLFGLDLSGSSTLMDKNRFFPIRKFTNLEYFVSPRNLNIPLEDYVGFLEGLRNIKFLTIYGSIGDISPFAINDFEMISQTLPDSIEKLQMVVKGDPEVITKGFDIIQKRLQGIVEEKNRRLKRDEKPKPEIRFIGKIANPEDTK